MACRNGGCLAGGSALSLGSRGRCSMCRVTRADTGSRGAGGMRGGHLVARGATADASVVCVTAALRRRFASVAVATVGAMLALGLGGLIVVKPAAADLALFATVG